ncbi:MAG: hypothetical protein ABSC55_21915 [Syntrophorhabdales bacterium]|jgi:hypothetical protein
MKKLFVAVMALMIPLFISASAGAVILYDDPSGDNPDGTKTYYGGITNIGFQNIDVLGVSPSKSTFIMFRL